MSTSIRIRNLPKLLLAVTIMALIAAGCGSNSEPEADADATSTTVADVSTGAVTEAPATDPPPPVTKVEPEDNPLTAQGFDEDGFTAELADIAGEWRASNGAPAVTLSVKLPGMNPISVADGVVDLVSEEPVTIEDFFRIGSITKPMTAALVLQLVDEGLIELDDPVRAYLPGWLEGYQYADEITIRQLMNHTSGLKEYALDPVFFQEAGKRLETAIEPAEIIEFLAVQDPLFAPGAQYSYETGGFLTLGTVIVNVTGNSAAAEMRSRIFEPAGAENIYLTPDEFPPTEAVHGYGRDIMYLAGTAIIDRPDELGLMINDEPVVDLFTLPQQLLQSAGWTGGGNEAQAESVALILAAMFDGTILTEVQIAEFTAPTLDTTYGLGISTDDVGGTTVYSHGGGVPGFRSQAGYLPGHDVSYAFSASLIPLPEGGGVSELQAMLTPVLVAAVEALAG